MSDESPRRHSLDPLRNVATKEEFARALTEVRERASMTVRDVAKVIGMPDSTVGGYFAGRHLPPLKPPHILPDLLRACGVTEPAEVERWQETLHQVRRAPGRRPAGAPVPYRGLGSFQPEDAEWFYGREALTGALLARVRSSAADGPVMVVGASGAGKSSLLRAGLVAALRREGTSVVLMTPGAADPVGRLAAGLAPLVGVVTADLAEALRKGERLAEAIVRLGGAGPAGGCGVTVVIDQFEELFTLCADDAERRGFVEAVGQCPGVAVVVGLRADFYASALRFPCLATALQHNQVVVGPMTVDEVRRAIVEPARKAKVDVEEGFVELLLRDLAPPEPATALGEAHDAGALPLLSHVLLATWERGRSRELNVADYRTTGGLHGAVARTADTVFDRLTPDEQVVAKRMFLCLVRVGETGPDTRRRVPRETLLGVGAAAAAVLDTFVARRLLTSALDTVEMSHEALLRAWPRLRQWIDADRAGLVVGQQLAEAAEVWQRECREPAALYRGSRLVVARDWLAGGARPEATPLVREFVTASLRRERRRTARLYQTIGGLATLLLVAVSAGVVAVQQRREADGQRAVATTERNLALSRLVAARADRVREADVALASQLSLAAYRIAPTAEARASLLDASATFPATRLLGGSGVTQSVAYHPTRRLLVSGGADRRVRLWDLRDPARPVAVPGPLTGPTDVVYTTGFSPDGRLLAAGSGDRTVHLWDLSDPSRPLALAPLRGPAALVYSLAFSPDGRVLAAGSGDKTVTLWDVSTPDRATRLGTPLPIGSYAQSVAFSPDGRLLAVGADDASVRLFDVADPARPVAQGSPLSGPTERVYSVTFSRDGTRLAAGSADKSVHLWRLAPGTAPRPLGTPLTGVDSWVNSVAFGADPDRLALGSSDGTVRVWDLGRRVVVARLPHPGPVAAVTFAGDDTQLVSGAADGVVRLWRVPGSVLNGHPDVINGVAFHPAGTVLAVASDDVRLWDPSTGVPIGSPLTVPSGFAGALDFSPDGRLLAVGGRDGTVRLWTVTAAGVATPFGPPWRAHDLLIESLDFSPDGRTLATGSDDNRVRLWDLTDPTAPRLRSTPATFASYVYTVRFSPDGRLLAAGSTDKTARLVDVTDPDRPVDVAKELVGPDHYVMSLAFSPDGRTLAMGSADKTITLWDIRDPGAPTRAGPVLDGPTNYVYSLAFSPDGRTLAASITDGTVWLWDMAKERPSVAATLTEPHGALYSVAFSPDGRTLAAGGRDRTAWLWKTDLDAVTRHICEVAGDAVTSAEWARYVPAVPYDPPC
ncbi:helix-turn-helix domain-containing protein [Micromonosporaceae bacterium B7E4]